MRATHTDPRLLLFALTAAFVFALLAAGLVVAVTQRRVPPLSERTRTVEIGTGGAPTAEPSAAQPADPPAWVEDPMASPLEELRAP